MRRTNTREADASLPERLMTAGEKLFGQHGIDGVSLRQICSEAETKNHFAVQYHFGDSAGLIRAILAKREPEFELRRGRLLACLPAGAVATSRQLLEVLFRPFYDIDPIATRFILMLRTSRWGYSELDPFTGEMTITRRIMEMIDDRNSHVPAVILRHRLKKLTFMVLATACGAESEVGRIDVSDEMLADTFDMAESAVAAPVSEALVNNLPPSGTTVRTAASQD